jgi:chromosome partitioning protein
VGGRTSMRVLAVISRKGGGGKSSISRAVAVEALLHGRTSAIIDTDEQGTCTLWGKRRPHPSPPVLSISGSSIDKHLATLRQATADLAVIDTPPNVAPVINIAVRSADAALIVSGVYGEDLEQVSVLTEIVKKLNKPAAIVLNRVPQGASALREAKNALAIFRLPICPTALIQRVAHPYASVEGLTASESGHDAKAAKELASMYEWLLREGMV